MRVDGPPNLLVVGADKLRGLFDRNRYCLDLRKLRCIHGNPSWTQDSVLRRPDWSYPSKYHCILPSPSSQQAVDRVLYLMYIAAWQVKDIFAIQDDISEEISGRLRLRLTGSEKRRLTKRQTDDVEAYRLYLKGLHHWNRFTEDGFYKAIESFQQAVEKDAGYALAHTGLAIMYVLLGWNGYLPPKDAFPKAKVAALTALQLDPDLGEAHTALAAPLWLYDWQWIEAQKALRRSLQLNPHYPTSSHWYGEYLMTMGCHEEAIDMMKKGRDLDPLSLIINLAIGWAFYMARRYDDAIAQFRRTVELEPNYPTTHWMFGLVLRKMGRYELAITEGEKGVKFSGGSSLMSAALAQTFAAAGRRSQAAEILDELTRLAKEKYIAPYFFAGIHAGLGENDRAIQYLEESYEERSHWLIYLHLDPRMDGLPSNPRFQDMSRRIASAVSVQTSPS